MKNWNQLTADLKTITGEIVKVVEHYTILGEFKPVRAQRFVPYARRLEYAGKGRHHAKRSNRPLAWAASKLRDAGDVAFGSFLAPDVSTR